MPSVIPGYNYDTRLRLSYGGHDFISYPQKNNKHEGWVTEFVDQCQEASSLNNAEKHFLTYNTIKLYDPNPPNNQSSCLLISPGTSYF